MSNLYKIKQIIIFILIITLIFLIFLSIKSNKENKEENIPSNIEKAKETGSFCYYRSDITGSGFYDKAWMKLNLSENNISGEFYNLPAETDSKVGDFKGEISLLNKEGSEREALVWWNSKAEGMEVKEELSIKWEDSSSTVGFGEMIDRGDGVYVYKDKSNLFYIKSMNKINCESLEEKNFIEKYIRENISTIATDKAVLGGTWYVISVNINPESKTGEISYEDGHTQSKSSFSYNYDNESQKVEITKYNILK